MLLGSEIIIFLLWVATVVLMLRNKGGCKVWAVVDGTEYCPDEKKRDDVPNVQWSTCTGFAFAEM